MPRLRVAPRWGRFRLRLRDARIHAKLGLILVIPLVAVVALAAVRLLDSSQRSISAGLVRSLTVVSAQTSAVAQELHSERMAAVQLLAGQVEDPGAFNLQATRTDAAAGAYRAARRELGNMPDLVDERLTRVDGQLNTLDRIRESVLAGEDPAAVVLQYAGILRDMVSYQESVAQVAVDPDLAESIRAVAALSRAKSEMSRSAVEAFIVLSGDEFGDEQLIPFLATLTARQEALLAFSLSATPEQQALVDSYYTGGVATLADRAERDVLRSARGEAVISAEAAGTALVAIVDDVRFAEQRLHADQVALATTQRDAVSRQVLVESVAVLVALAIAIVVAALLARMLARSLTQLRESALHVAEHELPETVARLSDQAALGQDPPAQLAAQVREPIRLRGEDEIGQVAQAFNVVHRTAVRVAAEQAALRTSVSVMFSNLARRSQTLVDQMIAQLDDIERSEEDPKRLSRLFGLDHLATRMRRNDENLLILAGADSSPPRTEDALVVDALRAAQSEIEHYDRIEFGTVDTDIAIVAGAVNDVVRLIAELFDNATRFSPPDSAVVAETRRVGDRMIVQIEDHGLGLTREQTEELNARLAAPSTVDITAFRMMGLAVVGKLAARYQIRVELRYDPGFGTVAYVTLPWSILVVTSSWAPQHELPVPYSPMPAETTGPVLTRQVPAVAQPPSTTVDHNTQDTTELPVLREMEAVWFRNHGRPDVGPTTAAAAPPPPLPRRPPGPESTPVSHADAAAQRHAYPPGCQQPESAGERWRTAADNGWRAASAAADPPVASATSSGLPKRVPQAQLVPGGIEPPEPGQRVRRSPDEVRGLLAAYHRGVRRGRSGGGDR